MISHRIKLKEARMKKDELTSSSFYSSVGQRIKRWWKSLERFGFEVCAADFDDVKNDSDVCEEVNNDEDFIGDLIEKGDNRFFIFTAIKNNKRGDIIFR
jgi:hypothetical protein